MIQCSPEKFYPLITDKKKKSKEKKKKYTWEKRKSHVHCLLNDMIVYVGEPKDSSKRLWEIIREFGKIAGYKNQNTKINSLCTQTQCHAR